jgi:hypothetical protein
MKNNRLELLLDRNQRSALFDLLLALLFIVTATATGFALKASLQQLTDAPAIAASPGDPDARCARRAGPTT